MRHFKFAALVGALTLICAFPQISMAQIILITDAEAQRPAASDTAMATRGLTRGPGIEILLPTSNNDVKSPLPLKIKFIARNNIAIDPASVKLTYLRVPVVDLTDRIKTFTTKDGIEMTAAQVPPGKHLLRLDLKDTEGRSATSTFTLTVVK